MVPISQYYVSFSYKKINKDKFINIKYIEVYLGGDNIKGTYIFIIIVIIKYENK